MPIDDILRRNLTNEQYLAATDTAEEVLCLACAGSGKSRTLAFRIARLISEGEPAESIVAFTFTDKAAESIKRSVAMALREANIEPTILGKLYIGTIHSYCQYLLGQMDARYRQFDVLDDNKLRLYLISRFYSLHLRNIQQIKGARYFDTINQVANAWTTLNDELLTIGQITLHDESLGTFLDHLSSRLDEDEYIDFSLMVRLVVDALNADNPNILRTITQLKHLMVDEYQDVNPAQESLIRKLHARSRSLFVVGDDDQAIYSWRGADVSNIIDFNQRYINCSSHTLSMNFRSTAAIISSSNEFIANQLGPSRIDKHPISNPNGIETPRDYSVLFFNNRLDEASWVARRIELLLGTEYVEKDGSVRGLTPADFAILMRSTRTPEQDGNPRHAAYSNELERFGLKFTIEAGGGIFDRPHARVVRDTLELLRDGSPNRQNVTDHFRNNVTIHFPDANLDALISVLTEWGRLIHEPTTGARRKVYPQLLIHQILSAFGIQRTSFDDAIMQDLGVFSSIILDVEAVYISIDSPGRFSEILNFLQNIAETGYDISTLDVLRRPDAITISTVHKMKGLEYPVVFVVDVEKGRFPGNRRNYEGWLPAQVINHAVARGAYCSTHNGEARLFYTAITRAERFLYITGSMNLPGGKKRRSQSPYALQLHSDEISNDPSHFPLNLSQHVRIRRIDETIVPTTYTDIKYYLTCPRDYLFRKSYGFSPPVPELFGFGLSVHTAVGKLHEQFPTSAPTQEETEELVENIFHLKHTFESNDPENHPGPYERARRKASDIAKTYTLNYATDFSRERQVEVRFEIPVQQAVITGAIDLLLKEDESGNILDAKVIDFKSMDEPEEENRLAWTELSLQVQLYAKAAREVLGENARTGSVHLLNVNQRIDIPVTEQAVSAAVANVEWAVNHIIQGDFPQRPFITKCNKCDFKLLCSKIPGDFSSAETPPAILTPINPSPQYAKAFSQFEPNV
ncbi:MAG: ATP-dependent DNA helicase [Bacteroidota bacterium]